MKLEILKDNKTTKARVRSIMIVSNHMGAQWVEKGWAKDLSNPIQEEEDDVNEADALGEIEMLLEDEGFKLDQEHPKKNNRWQLPATLKVTCLAFTSAQMMVHPTP